MKKTLRNSLERIISMVFKPKHHLTDYISRFKQLSKDQRRAHLVLSFTFPLLLSILITLVFWEFPVASIMDRFVPLPLLWIVMLVFSLLIMLMNLFVVGAWFVKLRLRYGSSKLNKNKNVKIKTSKQLMVIIANSRLFPNILVFGMMLIGNLQMRTWNIYMLSIYFGIIFFTNLGFSLTFQVSSVGILRSIFKIETDDPILLNRVKERIGLLDNQQYFYKLIFSVFWCLLIYFSLDFALDFWLGASNVPLWAKLAMAFLHGQ